MHIKIYLTSLLFILSSCTLFRHSPKSYAPEMVMIAGGSFTVGDFYEEANTDALPLHQQTIKPFLIGKYEVTFDQYDDFANRTGRKLPNDGGFGRDDRAVVYVNWDDANAFCKSLGYRLPSEIEWEYAARSGGQNYLYSGTNDPDSLSIYALINNRDINFSLPVGTFRPNKLGLHDMSGNAFEWVDEFYQFYRSPEDLHDHKNDAIRIIRGGSFNEERATTRTYWRAGTLRDVEANDIGFRCATSK